MIRLVQAGSMLGTAAVIVMDETICMVKALLEYFDFYKEESCGQCTPCREGTGWLMRLVRRIEEGHGDPGDVQKSGIHRQKYRRPHHLRLWRRRRLARSRYVKIFFG